MSKPPTGPTGPMPPEMMREPLAFEVGHEQRPDERKNHDRLVIDPEIAPGSIFVGVFDGASDGDGATAAEAAREATLDYVVDEITPVLGNDVGSKLLAEAIHVAHPYVEQMTGTINTEEAYEEGGTTTAALALIHPVEGGGYDLDWASAGDSRLRVYDRENNSLLLLNPVEVLYNPVGGYGFGGTAGVNEGMGVREAGSLPWKSSYELIASTDGENLEDEQIIEIMAANPRAEDAAIALADASEENATHPDDITWVVVHDSLPDDL